MSPRAPINPIARILVVPGQSPPPELKKQLENHGFLVRSDHFALYWAWVGSAWDQGLTWVQSLPESQRRSMILVGESPPCDIGPRTREAGCLTWAVLPLADWLPPLLLRAATRPDPTPGLLPTLAVLNSEPDEDPLRSIRNLAEAAGLLLGADLALFHIECGGRHGFLVEAPHGAVVMGTVTPGPDEPDVPPELIAFTQKLDQLVVLPHREHIHCMPRGKGAAIAVPVRRGPSVATLCLLWREPHLPTSFEVRLLEGLATLAGTLLNRLTDHQRVAEERQHTLGQKKQEIAAITRLARTLESIHTLPEAEDATLAAIGNLAHATAAVGLWRDPSGKFYVGGIWCNHNPSLPSLKSALSSLHLDGGGNPDNWAWRCRLAIEPLLARAGRFAVFDVLVLDPQSPMPAILLLSPDSKPGDIPDSGRVSPFLPYACAMADWHVRAIASRTIEKITLLEAEEGNHPEQLLQVAADQLRQTTGADVVLIYLGDNAQMKLVCSSPGAFIHGRSEVPGPVRKLTIERGTLAFRALEQRHSLRIPDAQDPDFHDRALLDPQTLAKIMIAFGISRLRSWCCIPVLYGRRVVGAIKLLTADAGRYLGPAEQQIAETVARRLAWELQKVSTLTLQLELDRILRGLADRVGAELGPAVLQELDLWFQRFVRQGCGLAVIARTQTRTILESGHPSLAEHLPTLSTISTSLGTRSLQWARNTPARNIPETNLPFAAIAAAITLPGETALEGHLFVTHLHKFSPEQAALAQQAARALSILLNAERIRQTVSLGAAFFRHALLGAVQGLSDTALQLVDGDPLSEQDRREAFARIHEECENIRFWSATQRLMRFDQPGVIETRPRSYPLKKLFETCVSRYRPLFVARGIRLLEEWREKGSLTFEFDVETLDLAISNLLHNATKYAFYNREVTMGAQLLGEYVQIWVEDIGHPLPENVSQALYQQGRRFVQDDPLRAIPGEGLGLYMVRRIIEAHQGRITHLCEREKISPRASFPPGGVSRSGKDEKTPYRVRFTLEIPHHWRGRGRTS